MWVDTGHTLLRSARHSFDQSMHVAVCSTQLSHIWWNVCVGDMGHTLLRSDAPDWAGWVRRGNVLCSATLDGISVGDTGRILLRSAHIFDGTELAWARMGGLSA